MKVLVLGSKGQLGVSLAETAADDIQFIGLDLPDVDITDVSGLQECCLDVRPNIIVNAAAYTAVDRAESESELAAAVNVDGPKNIAAAARNFGARLIHISTDFVFDGSCSTPYKADAETHPVSVYGRTKRDGEQAVLEEMPDGAVIIRTSWLYSKTGVNFVKTMLRLMRERDALNVVADQRGTPTWANSLAEAVWGFALHADADGIYHWTDSGDATWHDFATAIRDEAISLGLLERRVPIHPIDTSEYPTPARRPPYSVLDCSAARALLGLEPPHWRVNLRRMLEGLVK
jgi:dTDP-4-dehydrorhamnose reductase